MRSTLGVAVFSGMLGVTLFGIFLTPVFFYVIERLTGKTGGKPSGSHGAAAVEPTPPDVSPGEGASSVKPH